MRASQLACALLLIGCGAAPRPTPARTDAPHPDGPDIDVAPAFEGGRSYQVLTDTATLVDNPVSGQGEFRVAVESTRSIERGGVYGREPLSWHESITRVQISGQHQWDSDGDTPPPDDLAGLAALVGAKYTVDIAARGGVTIRDLDLPMPRLDDEARAAMKSKLADLETIARSLANSVSKSLAAMPHRSTHPGDEWTHRDKNPDISPDAEVTTTWTFEKLDGGTATFRVAGRYQSKVLEDSQISGRALFDVERRLYREIDMTTELRFGGQGGKVVTKQRVVVTPE